jgi:tetratricopeptide (TPR) repeat protein
VVIARPAGSVRLVETETGRIVAVLEDPRQSRSRHATFSADGSRLILASEDAQAVHVWDLRAIRQGLVAIRLDWDWPPFPEPDSRISAPNALRVVTDLGDDNFSWGEFRDPRELDRLNEAIEISPEDYYALSRRIRLFASLGRLDDALADCSRALAIRPGDPRVLALRGEAYLAKKKYGPGLADLEASLVALPKQAGAQNLLARGLRDAPTTFRDPAKALTHARLAVQLAPEIQSYHVTLGRALYRAGKYSEAVAELEPAIAELGPYDASQASFYLAMGYAHLKNADRARVHFDHALRLQAESHVLRELAEQLEAIHHEAEALLTKP